MEENCPVCGILKGVEISRMDSLGYSWVTCPCCGRFHALHNDPIAFTFNTKDKNKLSAYLYYHSQKFMPKDGKGNAHYNFLGDKEDFDKEDRTNCTLVTDEMVENWYPKNFNEKIDMILLGFAKQSKYYGDSVALSPVEKRRAFFIGHIAANTNEEDDLRKQIDFIESYLHKNYTENTTLNIYKLTHEGWARVDELQKNQAETSKTVFVAMSFASEMKDVRECIRQAIIDTGYEASFMDEVQHNKQIVPEMLYQIRQAKFLVAELTGHNNGAYFEAGYALGLGKEVIQVCSKESFGADGHFDVKQVSTILWEEESEITEKLAKRIEATIGSIKGK